MSKECIDSCPRIRSIASEIEDSNLISGPLSIHPDWFSGDNAGFNKLLRACQNSYDCSGPITNTVSVKKGVFRRRTEMKTQVSCGLEAQSAS